MADMHYTVQDFLGAEFECSCGRTHKTRFANYLCEKGAMEKVPELLEKLGYRKPFILCDTHTYAKAAWELEQILKKADIPYGILVLESPEKGDLPAGEEAMGKLVMGFDMSCDFLISVGTGTLNDLGRYYTFIRGMEYMLVATAPSMDGLVSGHAPLIHNNMKITYPAHAPLALVADLDVMCEAPMKMLNAGVGDILGKYNCLADWKLAHIINDEYYCEKIESIVRDSVEKTESCMLRLKERKEDDVRTLTEALTLSGMAMDFSGNSRPASGAEHHMSHFWEMRFLLAGKPAVLHGAKVGIGTVVALRMYNELAKMEKPDFEALSEHIGDRLSGTEWEKEINRAYHEAGPSVIELENKAGKNDPERLKERLKSIEAHWDEIIELAKSLPDAHEIEEKLRAIGAPTRPADVDIPADEFRDGILYGKEVRDRYTILQFLWDIDQLEPMTDLMTEAYL